jgi:signal transduction histidine kinase
LYRCGVHGVGNSRRRLLLDGLLWAVLSLPIVYDRVPDLALARLVPALAAVAVAVALGRRHPLASLLIVIAGSAVEGNLSFAIPVMSYLVGLRTARARPVAIAFATILVGGSIFVVGVLDAPPSQWFLGAGTVIFAGVLPWLIGRYRAQQLRLASAGWELADRLERERLIVAGQARLRERASIARDMHDSLGHELSLIALRAAALEMANDVPEPQRAAARELRESAAAATDRLREITRVLREEGARPPLEPLHEPVEELVGRARSSGLAVSMRRTGPADAAPPPVQRAAYRVVQEALTNASRYAPGAAVTVTAVHAADTTTVTVTNDPPPAGPLPTIGRDANGGTGLVGLNERVRLTGGTLSAEPHAGGFRVCAHLPHHGQVVATDSEPAIRLRRARRQVRRSVATAIAVPAALGAVMAVSYYPFAVFQTVLPADDFARMASGTPRADIVRLLPARQALEQPTTGLPPAPPDSTCEFYTDGNFPMAQAIYRLCFAGGRLVAKDNLLRTEAAGGG